MRSLLSSTLASLIFSPSTRALSWRTIIPSLFRTSSGSISRRASATDSKIRLTRSSAAALTGPVHASVFLIPAFSRHTLRTSVLLPRITTLYNPLSPESRTTRQ